MACTVLARSSGPAQPKLDRPGIPVLKAVPKRRSPQGVSEAQAERGSSSLNSLIRLEQQRLRDGEPQRLGSPQIEDQLELRGLLDGKITRVRAPENLVHVAGSPPVYIGIVRAIRYETPGLSENAVPVNGGKPFPGCELDNP